MADMILRKTDVEKMAGMCEHSLRRMEADGLFPQRVKLTPNGRAVGWRASEVQAWMASRSNAGLTMQISNDGLKIRGSFWNGEFSIQIGDGENWCRLASGPSLVQALAKAVLTASKAEADLQR